VHEVRSYYRYRFYEHQPDLNTTNPQVLDEIAKVIGFWLTLGVTGFRLDAAPFLMDLTGIDEEPETNRLPVVSLRNGSSPQPGS
jgi:maltose alpha-D-glucosyltransferase/alpha-amylase